jgi:hypothetical protein
MLLKFDQVWIVDFEFTRHTGCRVIPICMAAYERNSGYRLELWQDQLLALKRAPFSVGANSLFVAFSAAAEMGCFRALGWQPPENVLDLYAEFRVLTDESKKSRKYSLLEAMEWFGLDCIGAQEKEEFRKIAIRGGPFTGIERVMLTEGCWADVEAETRLLAAMEPRLESWEQAKRRGWYTISAAGHEYAGVPMDVAKCAALQAYREPMRHRLIERVDPRYRVFEHGTLKDELLDAYMQREGIEWPRTATGRPSLREEVRKEMVLRYPKQLTELSELVSTLAQLKSWKLGVGPDGRHRPDMHPFGTVTGRSAPKGCVFMLPKWMRALIKPEPGMALCYLDYAAQEFAVAAYLSGDPAMIAVYEQGDPYVKTAKLFGKMPEDGTKESYPEARKQFKVICLSTIYGKGPVRLARDINLSVEEAKALLKLLRRTYPVLDAWLERVVRHVVTHGRLRSVFGQACNFAKPLSAHERNAARNFIVQSSAAEMLQIACCMLDEAGVKVVLPVHDAVLIEAPEKEIRRHMEIAVAVMRRASAIVLNGPEIRVDPGKPIFYPDRYMDEKAEPMWLKITRILAELEKQERDNVSYANETAQTADGAGIRQTDTGELVEASDAAAR